MITVLILDDDDSLRVTLEQMLQQSGYKVITSDSGVGAARIVKNQGVDLLITDIHMPEREGLETIEEVRTAFPDLPIIVMSGADRRDLYLDTAHKLGANRSLTKPFTMGEMLQAISEVLGK